MPKLAASISWMFNEAPLIERFQLAAVCGFRAVEIQAPYDASALDLVSAARDADVEVVLINTPAALAAVPGATDDFQTHMMTALSYAEALNCPRIHCLAGVNPGEDAEDAEDTLVENVRWAADAAADSAVTIMLEPLNTLDHPGYALTSSRQALRIIGRVGRGNVRLQYDCYHMQLMEGRLVDTIATQLQWIDHIQISGVPARCEPDADQEINYPYVLQRLDQLGYAGWVGCEYRPRGDTMAGLVWARAYGIAPPTRQD